MIRRLLLALVLVSAGLVAGLVLTGRMQSADEVAAVPGRPPADDPTPAALAAPAAQSAAPLGGALPDFSDVAARAVPGVTNISSLQVVRTPNNPFFNDPFFRSFFGDDPDMFGWRERRGESAGSGVIVSPDGYVLTNAHVVGTHMKEITVVLSDRRERSATLVGIDPPTDLAVLKIDGQDLPALPWGDSSRLRVAEWVLAIGNPFQLGQTVTLGIVSAVGRTNVNVADYEDFIQTDAAINPGNSGGALVNRRGELVGINTAIFSQSGGYQGIGFAVPSNLARRVLDDIVRYGEVRRGSIGTLVTVNVTPALAADLQLDNTRGALVWRMRRDSAAYEAGIRPGDVLVSFNRQPIDDASHFLRLLADSPIGSAATIGLQRAGERLEVKVRVEASVAQQPTPQRRRGF
ncbi:MAG: trypsin-like peptidase domain-containing protein [Acidobacteria bacterium]|nr:trypsin-like peptidase domain-containing protein [Acidobacteriota bacterium]